MNIKYIPNSLNYQDKQKQKRELEKSKKLYKKNKYYTRKPLKSFQSKRSKHLNNVEKMYGIKQLKINNELVKKTGCSKKILKKIVNKGMGAYYSSGSRPNQTAKSWGMARLASAITGGPASKVDAHLLKQCHKK
jgi:CRISPR/Cas system CSM-associated protein Csm4 (group 5 of RAMP superfamily)